MATPKKTVVVEIPDAEAEKEQLNPRMTQAEAFEYLGAEVNRAHKKYEENGGDRACAARRDACFNLAKIVRDGDPKATYTKEELAVALGDIQDDLRADVPEGKSAFEMMLAGDGAPAAGLEDDDPKE